MPKVKKLSPAFLISKLNKFLLFDNFFFNLVKFWNLNNFSNFLIYFILLLSILNLLTLLLSLFFLRASLLSSFLPGANLLNNLIIFYIKISKTPILLKF